MSRSANFFPVTQPATFQRYLPPPNRFALPLDPIMAGVARTGVMRRTPQKKKGGQPYINKSSPQWAEVQCYTVEEAQRYAERVLPGANLQYIPKKERNEQNWVGPTEYLDPKRGLLTWCHEGAPRTKNALMRTKMYVIDGLVGSTVDAVAKAAKHRRRTRSPEAAKEAEVGDWNVEARAHALLEEWKRLPSAPYPGLLEATTAEEMYVLIREKEANMVDFKKWLEVRPPEDADQRSLANSMENLLLADKKGDDNTTTKADIDVGSTFDFEEWENQDVSNRIGETIAEEEMPPLEEAQGPNIEEVAYSPA
ncbi:hypothetical protein RhiJN_26561 [Ceratobasidium sp. AG-Ba]|nr:hypothetical protein RhiJN_12504 [Ceratobasidium sp. AG-Ba]QRV98542.1 hypothetical protein RhiJN_26561 [Ceratobasidium sp. AG-Ba]